MPRGNDKKKDKVCTRHHLFKIAIAHPLVFRKRTRRKSGSHLLQHMLAEERKEDLILLQSYHQVYELIWNKPNNPLLKRMIVYPNTRCRLKTLKMERIKDYLLLEEEFVQNQERLKPAEERDQEERTRVDDLRGSPMAVGTLEEIIDDDHVIVSSSVGPEYYVSVMSFVDKDQLEPGCSVLLHHKTMAVVGVLQDDTDPMVSVMKLEKAPTESYADIGGLETQIQEIKVYIESNENKTWSFMSFLIIGSCRVAINTSRIIRRNGYQTTKRCHSLWCTWYRCVYSMQKTMQYTYCHSYKGKTLLAKAVANQTSATFLRIVGSELIQKYLGDGPKLVRELFRVAEENAPAIVFIDEIDAVGTKRYDSTSGGEREIQRTMLELLNQLDGFDSRGDVKVIMATNKIDSLDPALIRPGKIPVMKGI